VTGNRNMGEFAWVENRGVSDGGSEKGREGMRPIVRRPMVI
jgi:hypothetical protein